MGVRGKETVGVLRESVSGQDGYGNETVTISETFIKGCLVAWGSSSLTDTLFQLRADTVATLFFPKGTILEYGDTFRVRGELYEANGSSLTWVTQKGSPVGTKVIQEVKHVTG